MFNWITGLFSGGSSIAATILVYVAVYAAGGASGAWVTHKVDSAAYAALVAANTKAQLVAVQKAKDVQAATDKIALDAAVAEAAAQQKIVVQHDVITQEITKYVPVHVTCITYGIVRLLNAASIGADPANVTHPAGQSDDACAPISPRALATNIIANYSIALQNAEQLNSLEAWITATVSASKN